jgi:broad specificity phosphatase PhoE
VNNYCTFYIVRHAESEANIAELFAGDFDSKLSPKGVRQAQKRAKDLRTIHFDASFSSDLIRAHHTAKIIAKEHEMAVTALKILREKAFGVLEGRRYKDLEEDLRKKLDVYYTLDTKERWTHRPVEGMETLEELTARIVTFLRETALAYPNKTVLVVSHGSVIRTLLVHLGFASVKELPTSSAANTCYFVLKSDGIEFEIVKTVGIEKKESTF